MLLRCCLVLWLTSAGASAAKAGDPTKDQSPVALCRALERLEPGDQIPVLVSGLYSANSTFYDPQEPSCRFNVDPSVCVEFSPSLERPREFDAILQEDERASVTFGGVLHGPKVIAETEDTSIPVNARLALANSGRFCAHRFRAKLVVDALLGFEKVPDGTSWSGASPEEVTSSPLPLEMSVPSYPWKARNLMTEGSVLLWIEVVHGLVAETKVQLGDPVLVEEAVANVKTWRFDPNFSDSFVVEFEFRLEKRPSGEGANPRFEMRLPGYIKVVGAQRNW